MTIKTAQLTLAALGLTLKRTGYGTEFRVAYRGLGEEAEATAYYTDDLDDAVATGKRMALSVPDPASVATRKAVRAAGFDPDLTPKTSVTVNNMLRALGKAERLVRGRGYWYFIDGAAFGWYSQSVPVCRITDLPLYRWVMERDSLAADYRNH